MSKQKHSWISAVFSFICAAWFSRFSFCSLKDNHFFSKHMYWLVACRTRQRPSDVASYWYYVCIFKMVSHSHWHFHNVYKLSWFLEWYNLCISIMILFVFPNIFSPTISYIFLYIKLFLIFLAEYHYIFREVESKSQSSQLYHCLW